MKIQVFQLRFFNLNFLINVIFLGWQDERKGHKDSVHRETPESVTSSFSLAQEKEQNTESLCKKKRQSVTFSVPQRVPTFSRSAIQLQNKL